MTKHYQQLRAYVANVRRDYPKGTLAAIESDLHAIGAELGSLGATNGLAAAHRGLDQLAAAGIAKLSDWLSRR